MLPEFLLQPEEASLFVTCTQVIGTMELISKPWFSLTRNAIFTILDLSHFIHFCACNIFIHFHRLLMTMNVKNMIMSVNEPPRDKTTKWLCAQRRLKSAWTSAQADQSLRCALNGWLRTQAFFMRTAKTLIRLGGCPGWSESSLGAQSFCWFCHEVTQMYLLFWHQWKRQGRCLII